MNKEKKQKIEELLTRNVSFTKPDGQLRKQLESGKTLRVKFGIDPTGNRLHIGRAATLMKLLDFQNLGHQVILIIGDFTALIGDASDKDSERPMLSRKDVKDNLKNYLKLVGKVIDVRKCEIKYNSKWLSKLDFNEIGELANNFSVAEMLDRENFSKRFQKGERISLREFLYPLMQGYDSVAVKSDVELGGNDQLFNLLAGRTLQKAFGQEPQAVIGTKLINAANGEKMSTSLGNCIYVDEEPSEMFGKIMAMKDSEMESYFETLTRVDMDEVKKATKDNPRDAKMWLASEIVQFFHGEKEAERAKENFINTFQKGNTPDNIDKVKLSPSGMLIDTLAENNIVESKSQVRRLLAEGAIKIDGEKVMEDIKLKPGQKIQVGKKKWVRVG